MRINQHRREKQAFTIIEFLLATSIIIIIGTFSALFFTKFLNQNSLSNTADQLLGEMRKAQTYAMMGRRNGSWGVDVSSSTITLFQGNSFIARNPDFDEKFNLNSNIVISGFSEIVFAKTTGLPNTGPLTITLSNPTGSTTLTLNAYGISSR